jgi:hypothetical protein
MIPSRMKSATPLGVAAVSCALLGLSAFVGYGAFATRGIYAAHARDMVTAHRMASYSDGLSFAQLLLGVFAVGLGWIATARRGGTALAKGLGTVALGLGVVVLLALLILV